MGYINLPSLDDITQEKDPKMQMEKLVNTVGLLMKSLSEINGYLQSKNIMEVGGYKVNNTDLMSDDGDVGLSSANDTSDPVRIWAGGSKETANFRVPRSGKMHATGATIESQSGYPKVIFDPESNFFEASQDENHLILISPFSNGTPSIQLFDGVLSKSFQAYISPTLGRIVLISIGEMEINSQSADLKLNGSNVLINGVNFDHKANKTGANQTIFVAPSYNSPATMAMTISDGVVTGFG